MGNNSVPKFISRLSRFPVYRGSVLGRFYCSNMSNKNGIEVVDWIYLDQNKDTWTVCQLLKEDSAPCISCVCLDI